MRIRVIRGNELTPDLIQEWSRVQQRNPEFRSPYFCPEFTQAVAGVRDDVFVALLARNSETVGFFPFQRGRLSMGRPVGGTLSDYQGAVIDKGIEWDAKQLMSGCGLASWDFDHLLAGQQAFAAYHESHDSSPYMDLTAGFARYAAEKRRAGSKQIEKVIALERKLEREVGPVRFEPSTMSEAVLDKLVQWKRAQYRRTGALGSLACKWTVELLRAILQIRKESFGGVLSGLYAGDELVAAHVGMRSRAVLHYWFPAYDTRFGRYSPGLILLVRMAEQAGRDGIQTVDLGKGDALYKRRLMSGAVPLAEGSVCVSRALAAIKGLRRRLERRIRASRVAALARVPAKSVLRAARWVWPR